MENTPALVHQGNGDRQVGELGHNGARGKVGKVTRGDREVRNVSMERANIRQRKSQIIEGREWAGDGLGMRSLPAAWEQEVVSEWLGGRR